MPVLSVHRWPAPTGVGSVLIGKGFPFFEKLDVCIQRLQEILEFSIEKFWKLKKALQIYTLLPEGLYTLSISNSSVDVRLIQYVSKP
jgi:hypothetical protein